MNGTGANRMTKEANTIISCYKQLNDEAFAALLAIARFRVYQPGERFLRLGERSLRSAFVLSGLLKSVWYDTDGTERIIELLEVGDFAANCESHNKRAPSEYEIIPACACRLLVFENTALEELCRRYAELMELGTMLTQAILFRRAEHTSIISMKAPLDRYTYVVNHRPQLLQQINLTELAKYLYVTRETISRCRSAMSRRAG